MLLTQRLNRAINALHPAFPKGIIYSAVDWVETRSLANREPRTKLPEHWYLQISEPTVRVLDFGKIYPATGEDYLSQASLKQNQCIRSPGQKLFCISGAHIIGAQGVVLSTDKRIFAEFTYSYGGPKRNPVRYRKSFPRREKLQGNYATLVYPDSSNYYHWLIESVPNIRTLSSYLGILDGIFVPKLQSFHSEILAATGIPEEKLIELDATSHFQCERLFVPSFIYGYAVENSVPSWLKEKLLPPNAGRMHQKNIYITRGDTAARRVDNENQITEMLLKNDFQVITASDLSVLDQASLFNEARIVIAPHGAGLANIVFCQSGTKILEIFPPHWTPLCYTQLAVQSDLEYHFMLAQPLGAICEETRRRYEFQPDCFAEKRTMSIPVDKLEKWLESVECQPG